MMRRLEDCSAAELIKIVRGLIFMNCKIPEPGYVETIGIPDVSMILDQYKCEIAVKDPPNSLCKILMIHKRKTNATT